jgi:DNA end-binding protein Ku
VELIERLAGDFEPERYEDSYRERLCEIIRAKQNGDTVPVAEVEEPEEPEDLLAALRRSVEEAKGRRRPARRNGGNGDGTADLSKDELLDRAKRLDVPGRSKMSKDELAKAVKKAQG